MAAIVWASANGLRNAALGSAARCAARIGSLLGAIPGAASEATGARRVGARLAASGSRFYSIFMAAMTSFPGLGALPERLSGCTDLEQVATVREGAYAGIATTARRSDFIATLNADLEEVGSGARTILFYDYFPAGYLFSTLRPRTPAVWMFPSDLWSPGNEAIRHEYARYYSEGRPLPDLVVRMNQIRLRGIRSIEVPELGSRSRIDCPDQATKQVVRRKAYSILRKRPPAPSASQPFDLASGATSGRGGSRPATR